VYEGRSFCDDSPLELWEQAIAGFEFVAEGAGYIGIPQALALGKLLGLRRILRAARPLFKSMKSIKFEAFSDMMTSVIGVVKDVPVEGILGKLRDFFKSAKNLGWKASPKVFDDLGEAASTLSKSGKLPDNYISKAQAKSLGWNPSKGNLSEVAPGKMIGGDIYKNRNGKLPTNKKYKEADLGYESGYRGKERIVYSEDGKNIYVTNDHYETFTELF